MGVSDEQTWGFVVCHQSTKGCAELADQLERLEREVALGAHFKLGNGIVENILQLSRREKSRPDIFDLGANCIIK